ncbi:MAG: response regulator [Chloroflexi bacterium]|nr:response regulator [Chloroflexota bacterium]
MKKVHDLELEVEALRERLSRLSEASTRISESLEFDVVLQGVLDSARSLTGALHGAMVFLNDSLQVQNFLTSGVTPEQAAQLWNMADGKRFFEGIGGFSKPVRHRNFQGYVRELGLPKFESPVEVSSPMPFLCAPITHHGGAIGIVYLADKEAGREFTAEDEETLTMFASQAALVIANARYHFDERRARADLQALVNTVPVGVLVFNALTGVPVYVNQETRRISNELATPDVAAEDVLEALIFRRSDGREVSLKELPHATALSTGETVRAEEIVMSVPGGQSLTVLLNATPNRSDDGEIESFVVAIQDLTPLEEAERLRAEFLGMVSHELRTPLAAIKGSATTLVDEASSLDAAETIQFSRIIVEQSERMRSLISDLLDIARIEAGTLSVSPRPEEVAVLLDDARGMFQASGDMNNILIEIPQHLPVVMADRRRIVQVIINLLSNAVRHSPDPSLIHVTAEHRGAHIAVIVADDGNGISDDHLPLLFRKFSRAENRGDDTGLGLAICKGIVEAHGGRIWAESDGPGKGAQFTFTLSVADVTQTAVIDSVDTRSRHALDAKGQRSRILVVDDDPQTLRYVRDVISKAGYIPRVTGDPREALHLLEEGEPDLVLLDLMLPGTDGIELMKTVRSFTEVPVIFLSAYGQDDVIASAFREGATDYVVKPFSPTELVARIRAALHRWSARLTVDVPANPYLMENLVIDYAQRRVAVAGRPVELTDTEYRVLVELAANADRIMTHEQLLVRVWGRHRSGGSEPVRTIVKRLRNKLQDDADNPTYIFTKRRVGYWMPKGEAEHGQNET